ncbi:hypothetical protein E2C01_063911 [Portunus trituberculatus]|uniref:Uncharacterized protein n=1 Tax=Portunus trituberculatus TaxID=210409 RepID=A0A5B7HAE8_PORTR|nr:hypothetical protein [Portunus trituberculatus]
MALTKTWTAGSWQRENVTDAAASSSFSLQSVSSSPPLSCLVPRPPTFFLRHIHPFGLSPSLTLLPTF